jgi:hypothetical protein
MKPVTCPKMTDIHGINSMQSEIVRNIDIEKTAHSEDDVLVFTAQHISCYLPLLLCYCPLLRRLHCLPCGGVPLLLPLYFL